VYTDRVIDRLRGVLEADSRIAYALVFGSQGRASAHGQSDADVAIGLVRGTRLSTMEIGDLVSRLEAAARGTVDLVMLDEAGPGLAYRVFRDGRVVVERERRALVERKARAILEYLDFKPVEETFARAVLEAAHRG
jgi:predicted nucleotidyltransferase